MGAGKGDPVTTSELTAILKMTPDGVVIPCRVQPRSSAEKVVGILDGALKIALQAPPVEGKANAALQKFLSGKLHLPKSAIHLVSGDTSRHKLVAVKGLPPEAVAAALSSAQ